MTRKTTFFEGWSWFKFNNLGLTLGTNLKFYTSVAKGLKLKVRKFWGLIPTFVEVTREKLVGGSFCFAQIFLPPHPSPHAHPILNRVTVKRAQEATNNQFLLWNVKNNETFEIFKMFKKNCWINVHYTKSKRL